MNLPNTAVDRTRGSVGRASGRDDYHDVYIESAGDAQSSKSDVTGDSLRLYICLQPDTLLMRQLNEGRVSWLSIVAECFAKGINVYKEKSTRRPSPTEASPRIKDQHTIYMRIQQNPSPR